MPPDPTTGRALRFELGAPDRDTRQVWIVCGQHGGEHPALWFAEGVVRALLARSRPTGGIRFHVIPVANPSGWRAGHLRTNADGVDPNRVWDRPHRCREVGSLVEAMTETGVDLLLDVHTDFEMGCVYLDVLDEWMDTPPHLAAVRERFERKLATLSPDVVGGRRYPWLEPPRPDLLAGMCVPAIERRFGAAAMTLELPVGAYRNAVGSMNVWSPARSIALGRAAVTALLADR